MGLPRLVYNILLPFFPILSFFSEYLIFVVGFLHFVVGFLSNFNTGEEACRETGGHQKLTSSAAWAKVECQAV